MLLFLAFEGLKKGTPGGQACLTASKVTHDKELVTMLLTDGENVIGKKLGRILVFCSFAAQTGSPRAVLWLIQMECAAMSMV